MAEIYVSVWNQDEVAMSSVSGELIIILITKDDRFQAQQLLRFGKQRLSFKIYLLATTPSLQDIQIWLPLKLGTMLV